MRLPGENEDLCGGSRDAESPDDQPDFARESQSNEDDRVARRHHIDEPGGQDEQRQAADEGAQVAPSPRSAYKPPHHYEKEDSPLRRPRDAGDQDEPADDDLTHRREIASVTHWAGARGASDCLRRDRLLAIRACDQRHSVPPSVLPASDAFTVSTACPANTQPQSPPNLRLSAGSRPALDPLTPPG